MFFVLVTAGVTWEMQVMGGLTTFCCLSGFQVRQGSMYVHVVEQKVLEKYVCNNSDEIIPEDCRKVLVTDLFSNAAPVGQIDLRLKDAVGQLVAKFVETHKSNPPVWDSLGLIQSARLQLQVKSEMQRQRKQMQLKAKKRKEEIEKKTKRARELVQAEKKQQQQLAIEARQRQRERERKAAKRKREQEMIKRAEKQKAVKVQRVALRALKEKSDKAMEKVNKELSNVKAQLLQCKKESELHKKELSRYKQENENSKLKVIIQTLREQLQTQTKSDTPRQPREDTPRQPRVNTPRRQPRVDTPRQPGGVNTPHQQLAKPRPPIVTPRPRVAPPLFDTDDLTPYDPELVLYDPETPVPYVAPSAPPPPYLQSLRQQRPPTRRQLPFPSPRVPFTNGTWGKVGMRWYY